MTVATSLSVQFSDGTSAQVVSTPTHTASQQADALSMIKNIQREHQGLPPGTREFK